MKVIFLTRRPSSVILDIQHMYRFDPGQFRGDFSMGIIVRHRYFDMITLRHWDGDVNSIGCFGEGAFGACTLYLETIQVALSGPLYIVLPH